MTTIRPKHKKTINFWIYNKMAEEQIRSINSNLRQLEGRPYIKIIRDGKTTFTVKCTRTSGKGFTDDDLAEIIYCIGEIQKTGVKLHSDWTFTDD